MLDKTDVFVSVVIPVFNEAEVVALLLKRLRAVLEGMGCAFEIVFVDDGSTDCSVEILTGVARFDPRVKVLSFCRNFGHQAAITAGLDFASGDAVIMMDADLQDPPELIPQMVALYQQGYEVVSAQRMSRQGESWWKRFTASAFYWVMRRMVDKHLQKQVGDFRLLSRAALTAIRSLREQHRFMRGLIAWLGLKEAVLPFERPARAAGYTKYPLTKMLRFSWTAITSFSALPLRLSTFLGLAFSLFSFAYFLYALWAAIVWKSVVPGWTSLVVLQCFFFGVLFLFVGMMGDYLARVYEEAKGRPLYVVKQTCNLSPSQGIARAVILHEAPLESTESRGPVSSARVANLL